MMKNKMTTTKKRHFKRLAALTLAATLALSLAPDARAGVIAWTFDNDGGYSDNSEYYDAMLLPTSGYYLALYDSQAEILDALAAGTFSLSTDGVVGFTSFFDIMPNQIFYADDPALAVPGPNDVFIILLTTLTPLGKSEAYWEKGIDFDYSYVWSEVLVLDAFADSVAASASPFDMYAMTWEGDGFWPAPASVPEPASALLALGGVALLLKRRRK